MEGAELGDADSVLLQVDPERAAWRAVGDELVLLELETSCYLSVNETGATVWPLLEVGTTRSALVDSILKEFDVDLATAEADISQFVNDLIERGLLLRHEDSPDVETG